MTIPGCPSMSGIPDSDNPEAERGLSAARKALVDGVWADAKISLYITFRIN